MIRRLSGVFETVLPVAWLPTVVRNGEDADFRADLEIDHVIRKARHRTTANGQVGWHPGNAGPSARRLQDVIEGGVDGVEELDAEVLPAFLVVSTGEAVLGVRFVFKSNARVHRRRNSSSARRRTSCHDTPADSPASTRLALRSISAAHAASTSAGSSTAASSRLASNCAATSARSSTGRASASRRSSCARGDMSSVYRDLTLRPRRRVPLADSLFVAVALDELPDSHPGASAVADVLLDGRQLFTAVSLYAQWEMMPGSKTMMYAGPRLHRMLSDLTGVLASSHRNPVVLAGDFNVTSQGARSSDNEAAAVFARLRAWRMADCIARMGRDQAGAADCKCPDGAACSHVRTFRTGTQLDYAFVSDSIVPALLDCGTEATAEAWRRSDHCPIVIDLDERAIWQTQQTA